MTLQQNTDHIQTTHISSLPRPHNLLDLLKAKYSVAGAARPLPVVPQSPSPAVTPGAAPAAPTLAALLGDRALQMGDEGDLVRAFQLALAKLGYDLKGTSAFGGATDTAVTHFQQSHGLEVDGEIGPNTAAAI